ncbi:MAG TPA: 4'-phosphopantetheinyl transferase superfamily protein [Gemmatimonadaceae bacterium]|nr:4'-phosphopantetheinyl transferase superfamily protein [Gemmatimonadaceae bacterium]
MPPRGEGDVWRSPPAPPLGGADAHVWRVALDDPTDAESYWPLLSDEEQGRAGRFYREVHRRRFTVAHGALRVILSSYLTDAPESLAFHTGEHGKPALERAPGASEPALEFNLSHSHDVALVAVALDRPVGVDVERHSEDTEHLELAERFFSPSERRALREVADDLGRLTAGFFAAWSRKEAYLKAIGCGITRGLHHFDVSLTPDAPAGLLADRMDPSAAQRWSMRSLDAAPGFSGALVTEAPLREVLLFDAPKATAWTTAMAGAGRGNP